MSARATFSLPVKRDFLTLPRDAIVRYPDGTTSVWVTTHDGDALRVREKRVKLADTQGVDVRVESGIEKSDQVVVRGNESLRDGQIVRLLKKSELTHIPGEGGK